MHILDIQLLLEVVAFGYGYDQLSGVSTAA